MAPEDARVLILGTCEYVAFSDKGDGTAQTKDPATGRLSRVIWVSQCDPGVVLFSLRVAPSHHAPSDTHLPAAARRPDTSH